MLSGNDPSNALIVIHVSVRNFPFVFERNFISESSGCKFNTFFIRNITILLNYCQLISVSKLSIDVNEFLD